ncbi:MAG TPA: 2-dehydropantoate 2-reductase N-terminal domain-containing protein [Candidatus Saccharimonadales bacterium]|nr:2-dehydropantoate 2-reductase N-terminal domain-containing protein [Candidatus Saccharimonadales bacterium]
MAALNKLNILLIGSGVIGSVYAGQFSLAGHKLWVLVHGECEEELAKNGIQLQDMATGITKTVNVTLARKPDERKYDLVMVAVRAEQLTSTFPTLRQLTSKPHILFLGNNPDGHKAIPKDVPGTVQLGFPGIAGSFDDKIVKYTHITSQRTTLEVTNSDIGKQIDAVLRSRNFALKHTTNIDGWLAYHAVFIASVSMALLRADNNAARLGNNRKLLRLMCRSIEEGFGVLRSQGVRGAPRNLAILHWPLLRPLAIHYWGNVMRSQKGEIYFAAHARHADSEVFALVEWVLEHAKINRPTTHHLQKLLNWPINHRL